MLVWLLIPIGKQITLLRIFVKKVVLHKTNPLTSNKVGINSALNIFFLLRPSGVIKIVSTDTHLELYPEFIIYCINRFSDLKSQELPEIFNLG
ncbi:hypothetical protein SAMN05660413_01235 [Salegentibacter flavus]|uniref:Uncharacterized protein n=1 Tax=Salegentibacter flavus TaxID=287099 RepID=A0A1I4ZA21_9FLAO|nr:hypothetical protein SAMN05660413_01235 [Salegentibacter flavus]